MRRWPESARPRSWVLLAVLLVPVALTACTFKVTSANPTLPNPNANEKFDLSVFHVAPGATFVDEDNQEAYSGRLVDGDKISQDRSKTRRYHFKQPISRAEFWKWALSVYPPPGWTLETNPPEVDYYIVSFKDKQNGARHNVQVEVTTDDQNKLVVTEYIVRYYL